MENSRYDPCQPKPENDCVHYPTPRQNLDEEAYAGSFQQLLSHNIGKFVSIEYLASFNEFRTVSGYIENVSNRYIMLRTKNNCRIAGDAWAIKLVTFPCCD